MLRMTNTENSKTQQEPNLASTVKSPIHHPVYSAEVKEPGARPGVRGGIAAIQQCDRICSFQTMPEEVVATQRLGSLNVHAATFVPQVSSTLPHYPARRTSSKMTRARHEALQMSLHVPK